MDKARPRCYTGGLNKVALIFVLAFGGMTEGSAQPREREILTQRPSGFWTSNRPAQGGAYRWRLLGIGTVLAGGMGILILHVLRKARESRKARIRNAPKK